MPRKSRHRRIIVRSKTMRALTNAKIRRNNNTYKKIYNKLTRNQQRFANSQYGRMPKGYNRISAETPDKVKGLYAKGDRYPEAAQLQLIYDKVNEFVENIENQTKEETVNFYNETILPELNLYSAEYLPYGAGSEIGDSVFELLSNEYRDAQDRLRISEIDFFPLSLIVDDEFNKFQTAYRKSSKKRHYSSNSNSSNSNSSNSNSSNSNSSNSNSSNSNNYSEMWEALGNHYGDYDDFVAKVVKSLEDEGYKLGQIKAMMMKAVENEGYGSIFESFLEK